MSKILVIGSINTDMVVKASHFPLPGETVMGDKFFMFSGGKGANQAVAAARLNSSVSFLGKVGNDIFGKQAIQKLQKETINTKFIFTDSETPSGVALITVDAKGENSIVVSPGANANLNYNDLLQAKEIIQESDIILMQLEISVDVVFEAAKQAFGLNKLVVLNTAPALPLPPEIYNYLYLITPNKSEAEALSGIKINKPEDAGRAGFALIKKGVKHVVITLGAEGAFLLEGNKEGVFLKSPKVNAVDTTAAGDIFNGALTSGLSNGKSLKDAVIFANAAAALSVTKMGAQSSAPYMKEVNDFLKNNLTILKT